MLSITIKNQIGVSKSGFLNLPYMEYRILSEQKKIVIYQEELTARTRNITVLNTTLFLLADYYGNRDRFYDAIMADTASKEQNDTEEVIFSALLSLYTAQCHQYTLERYGNPRQKSPHSPDTTPS